MKEPNGLKIIGIDHGYVNIKSSCTVTPTGLLKYETEPVFSRNILEYNGTYYHDDHFNEDTLEFLRGKGARQIHAKLCTKKAPSGGCFFSG